MNSTQIPKDTGRQPKEWLTLYLIPVLFGLIIALLIIVIKPQWFPPIVPTKQEAITEDQVNTVTDSFSGPVSYSTAVDRAAPAVVNIFTQRIIKEKKNALLDAPFLKRFFNKQDQPAERRNQV